MCTELPLNNPCCFLKPYNPRNSYVTGGIGDKDPEPGCSFHTHGRASTAESDNTPSTSAVLHAGDPRQLGPLLRSPLAANAGLGDSLLERLITYYRAIPQGEPARDVMCTVLVRNYRSHQRLLWLPSHLFYGDALLACADSAQTRLPQWSQLPGSDGVLLYLLFPYF